MAQMLLGKTLALLASVLLFDWAAGQSATIPADQEDACVNVNENTITTFTCSSPEFFLLWRVMSRQILSTEFESVGISVNTMASSGGDYNSTIEFSGEGIAFLASEVGLNVQFRVACLVEKASFDIVEGDSRTFVIYDTPPPPAEDVRVVPTDTALEYNVEWSRPASVLGCVMIVYKVTVINLETGVILRDNIGTTSQQYKYNDANSDLCQLHEFIVLSDVDGSEGEPVSVNVTLPISPNVADISNSLTAQPVLDSGVAIMVSFDPATSCNEADHPIVSYIITVSQLPQVYRTISHTGSRVTLTLTSPDLRDNNYTVIVTACTDILCLPAQTVSVVTSDVQDASIMFLNTTVSLVCVFTDTGTATGCRFTLTLPEEQTETFDLNRPSDGGVVSQMCATTQNMRGAYLSIVVQAVFTDDNDVKGTGEFKFEPFVNEAENVADISPCEPPTPDILELSCDGECTCESESESDSGGLSAGAIAGITFAITLLVVLPVGVVE